MRRRSVLKRAGTSLAGGLMGSATATTTTAAAVPKVTVRGHLEVEGLFDAGLAPGHGPYEYDTDGVIPGYHTDEQPNELAVLPNAWNRSPDELDELASQYRTALQRAGYDGPAVLFEWPSDDSPLAWQASEAKARMAGKKLAAFLAAFRADDPDTTIRIVGFSLGGRVALSAVRDLYDRGWRDEIASLSLCGAAVEDESVADGPQGEACVAVLEELDNFYSPHDDVLSDAFDLAEWDGALGAVGLSGTPTDHYEEHRVDWVDDHLSYWSYEDGCVRSVVAEWRDDDDSIAGSDPAASGSEETTVEEPAVTGFRAQMPEPHELEAHDHEYQLAEHDRIEVELTAPPGTEYELAIREGDDPLSRVNPRVEVHTTAGGALATVPGDTFDVENRFWIMVRGDETVDRYSVRVREYPSASSP